MDRIGAKTLEIMSTSPRYNKWLVEKMKKYLYGDILEVGGGIGNMSLLFNKYGRLTVIDIDRYYISRLKKKGFKVGFGDIEKGRYFFGKRKFDVVVSTNVLEHIKNDEKALKHMSKLLKSKGVLILLVPAHIAAFGQIDKSLGHWRRYTKSGLKEMFKKQGLEIELVRYLNFISLPGWFIAGKVLRRKIIPHSSMKFFNLISAPFLFFENFVHLPFGLSVLIVGKKP